MRVALVCEQLYALLDMNLYIEISHRAYWRHGRVRCILSEPPNKQALRIAQDSDLRSGSDRLRPLSISLETGAKMRSPMRHTLHLWEEYTLHKPWSAQTSTHEHWHIHYSSRTPPGLAYTQHPNRAFTHIAIAFTRHPTVAALAPHPPQSNSHHRNTHHIDMSKPKVGTRPAPSRHRSPTLSQTVRGHRHSHNTISRWKNLPRSPPAPRCEHASV